MAQKRKEHIVEPDEIRLEQMELRLFMGESYIHFGLLTERIFCMCKNEDHSLVDYVPYLNDVNDIVLKGRCNGCKELAVRYVEAGEDAESAAQAEKIRKLYSSSKKKL